MRGAVLQTGLVAPFAELVAKSSRAERAPNLGHKKRQISRWTCVDDALEFRHDWKVELNGVAVPILVLGEPKTAVANVLAPKTNDVGTTLTSIAQESQCEVSRRADWMTPLVPCNLLSRPGVIAIGTSAEARHVAGRIEGDQLLFHRPLEDPTYRLQPVVGCSCEIRLPIAENSDS